jgi:hypothetical protein
MLNVPLEGTQHENRGRSARILEAGKPVEIMQTGCGVHHGCWMRTDARGAGLSCGCAVGSGTHARTRDGESGIRVAGWGVEDMAAKTPGMAAGVKPRSREAVRRFPQGFTRGDGPGEDEWWGCWELGGARGMARWQSVHMQACSR